MRHATYKFLSLSGGMLLAALAFAQDTPPPSTDASAPVAAQNTQYAATDAGAVPAPYTTDELNSMVAPIALYPDALVAQVLGASTFPDEVSAADEWLNSNKQLSASALTAAVNAQPWDPSVKALTQFPAVLDNLANNLPWTSSLGQAFHDQQAQVMAAVQLMRAKAQDAGTLQSNAQIKVVQQDPQTIIIQPTNPQVVYVPQYNPAVVYGAPVVIPMYTPPPVAGGVGLFFGSGVSVGAAFGGTWGGGSWVGGVGWGWGAWNVNWGGGWGGGGGTVIYNHNTYISNTSWHSNTWNTYNRYNGYHPWNGGSGVRPYNPNNGSGYHPGTDTQYGPGGHFHSNGYFGPDGHFHPGACPNCRNGGDNGNRGLIGGNGGVYHGDDGRGPESHPYDSATGQGYRPGPDTHYGPNGGYHPNGYYGPNGGYHHDVPGANPHNQPNGGDNGNHGLIGGRGGNRDALNDGDRNNGFNREGHDNAGWNNQRRGGMSGNGDRSRVESDRGRGSMGGFRQQQHQEHPQHENHGSGNRGGGHRR